MSYSRQASSALTFFLMCSVGSAQAGNPAAPSDPKAFARAAGPRTLANLVGDFNKARFPYSKAFTERLSRSLERNYSFVAVDVTVPNDHGIDQISETIRKVASEGKSVVTVANTEALKAAAALRGQGRLVVVDISEANIDGLKFILNESLRYPDLESWKKGVMVFARGDRQLPGEVSDRRILEEGYFSTLTDSDFHMIRRVVAEGRVRFLQRDLKSQGLGQEIRSILRGNPAGAVYVSNVPEYFFGGHSYFTANTPTSSPEHFLRNLKAMSVEDPWIIGGTSIGDVKPHRLPEILKWETPRREGPRSSPTRR